MQKINKKIFIFVSLVSLFFMSQIFADDSTSDDFCNMLGCDECLVTDTMDWGNDAEMEWNVCRYRELLTEQAAVYKSMEHVNWISIEKIGGDGNTLDTSAAKGSYELYPRVGIFSTKETENPGILQKIDLWRQRLKTYLESKNLRPYYDSQRNPVNKLDNRFDESRFALLDWLSATRTKMEECVAGYSLANKENSAKLRLFRCQEGVTVNSSSSYRIAPDFPYPVHITDMNCYPLNSEYLTRSEKEECARNKDRLGGCQETLGKPTYSLAQDNIHSMYSTYLDDFYCTSGRQQTAK
ncbi:MAG: hypothetical protein PHR47_04130 [Candidatus Pacebacteria bacterium]|nr:hypothetical protein [Candidatus Paceibacterota bacterium]